MRALGISIAERFKGDPEIPTLAENGIPGFAGDPWQMPVAPANTPKDIVESYCALPHPAAIVVFDSLFQKPLRSPHLKQESSNHGSNATIPAPRIEQSAKKIRYRIKQMAAARGIP